MYRQLNHTKLIFFALFAQAATLIGQDKSYFHGGITTTVATYSDQTKMNLEHPLLARSIYGGNFSFGGIRHFVNFRLGYVRNQTTIYYHINSISYLYRRETSQFWSAGLRLNPLASTKYYPFIEFNTGSVTMQFKNYSNDPSLDPGISKTSFFMRHSMLQIALGYAFSRNGFRIEPFVSAFLQKKLAYPYLLKNYMGINFGYFFNEDKKVERPNRSSHKSIPLTPPDHTSVPPSK